MSRAFVKESEGADDGALAELRVSPHRNLVTPDGLRQIEEAITRLRAELARARAAEDREGMQRTRRDLRYWLERQRTAELVRPSAAGGKARFGSTVTLEKPDGGRIILRIVGEDEAEPASGKISYVSPIGRAVLGKGVGDSVELREGEAQIVNVE